jgi:6-phosphogluconolactonase
MDTAQTGQIQVAPTPSALAEIASQLILAAAATSIEGHHFFRVALSGGSTPRAIYQLLAESHAADFHRWQIFWSDERCVPPNSPLSNYQMVKETLLDVLPEPPPLVFRMVGEGDPCASAQAYENTLRELIPPDPAAGTGEIPRFDLILLGMGADGHTASLFPHAPALTQKAQWVVATAAPNGQSRLTLTYPLINAARRVLILVSGAEKASMLQQVLAGPHQPDHYPVQGVQPVQGSLTWLVDHAAWPEKRDI